MSEDVSVTVQRLMSTTDIRTRLEETSCDRCEAACWTVEVWLYDLLGTDAKACALYREHLGEQSAAIATLGRWLLAQHGGIKSAERAAWLLEHQAQLW